MPPKTCHVKGCNSTQFNMRWFFEGKTYGLYCSKCFAMYGLYKIMHKTKEHIDLFPAKRWSKRESKHPFIENYKGKRR